LLFDDESAAQPAKIIPLDPHRHRTYHYWHIFVPGLKAGQVYGYHVADPARYDWEGDLPLKRPFAETIIYELHVRGFTRHPSSGVASVKRGTYAYPPGEGSSRATASSFISGQH